MKFDLFEYAYQEEKKEKEMSENNALEIIIKEKQIGLLNWNFEELNTALDESLKRYVGVQYTDDQIAMAKNDRARLNAFKKAINDRKIELKKEFCAPYDTFAAQVKELLSKVDRCATGIDEQIKDYEARERQTKLNRINDYWIMNRPSAWDIPIERVLDERWLNKSCADKKWQKELIEIRDSIIQNSETILSWNDEPEKRDWCIREYMSCLDFGQTMARYEQFKVETARVEELKAEAERRRYEAEQKRQEAERESAQSYGNEPEPAQSVIYTRIMKVQGTREQIIALTDFMKSNGIKFWKM